MLPTAARLSLHNLTSRLRSLVTKEMAESEFALFVYGKTGRGEGGFRLGRKRADTVADFLRGSLPYGEVVKVVESSTKEPWIVQPVGDLLRQKNFPAQDVQSRSFPGVTLLVKDPGAHGANLTKGIERNCVIVAHECGHMFGLPDEYFGVNCLEMQQQVDLLSIIPKSLANLTRLQQNPVSRGKRKASPPSSKKATFPPPFS